MKIETYLNAMQRAFIQRECFTWMTVLWNKRNRQAYAFRARILKIDNQQREDIQELGKALSMTLIELDDTYGEIDRKDAEIKTLTNLLRIYLKGFNE